MEHIADVQVVSTSSAHWNTSSEQFDGIVGTAAVLDVWCQLRQSQGVWRVVCK